MTARRHDRRTGHLAAVARAARARLCHSGRRTAVARVAGARLRHGGRHAALALILAVGLGAWAGAIAGVPAFASGEKTGGSPSETGTSPTGTGISNCPSSNPPNQLTLVAGTPQTTTLETAFASGLQVALSNSDGCAVTGAAGVAVTFTAPAAAASGRFSASNSNTATIGADASGTVAAPTFTANGTSGSYTVTASSQYGSVAFSLTNTAAGIPARLTAIPLKHRSARVTGRFPQPLQVRVLDAGGDPVAGTTVTFTLGSGNVGACGTSAAASASFAGGGTQTTATTDASGLATSPTLTANTTAGSFTATASVSSGGGTENAGKAGAPAVGAPSFTPASFSLVNLAGKPVKIAPGVGSTQSTPAGAAFPIGLAVTVTDADKNPVPGALVTFSAPAAGASGRFTLRSHGHRHRAHVSYTHTVAVKTSACGIAVAPPFTATRQPGGYIVKASAKPARPAAFALVNEAP
jgi:protocatechuate 3,4-dioxygenase beta subunit